jgi:hypothetical protein
MTGYIFASEVQCSDGTDRKEEEMKMHSPRNALRRSQAMTLDRDDRILNFNREVVALLTCLPAMTRYGSTSS